MLSIDFKPPYPDFESASYSTNIPVASLQGEFVPLVTGAASNTITLSQYSIDRFGVERPVVTGSVLTGSSVDYNILTWQVSGISLVEGANIFKIKIVDLNSLNQVSSSCTITYVAAAQVGIRVDPPTGIDKDQYTDKVVLRWLGNSTVSYNEKQLVFTTGATSAPIPTQSGPNVTVVSDIRSPGAAYFDSSKIQASLAPRRMYNDALRPEGTGTTAINWLFSHTPVGLNNKPTYDKADVQFSGIGTGTSITLLENGKVAFLPAITTSTDVTATYLFNDTLYQNYTLRVETPGPAGIGDFSIVSSGKPVSHARINEALTSVADSFWSLSSLWEGGVSDLQTTFAKSERITVKFISSTEFQVTSDKGAAGTQGEGRVGVTFERATIKFTIADSGLYQADDKIVIDVAERAIFVTGTDIILDVPGVQLRVLNAEGCGRYDTALLKVSLTQQSNLPTAKPLPGVTEITLVEKGAVNLDSLTLTTSELNPAQRSTFTRDVDYIVISSEDINYPTKVAITEGSSIPFGVTIFASFQVTQAIESIKGYNIYASADAAGGTAGYVKLNAKLLQSNEAKIQREVVTSTERIQSVANGTRVTSIVERILTLPEYEFEVTRQALADFTKRATSDLTTYFVLTAVVADRQARNELESVYSLEVVAAPIEITSQVQEFTPRTFDEIVTDYLSSALVSQPLLDIKPTSVTRDIHIDPVANELEKAYVMLDFVNKSQSFLTLLAIDDPDNTGTSASGTEYKASLQLVFNLQSQDEVQSLIDSQFDKLAANVNVTRKGAESARGVITLYSLTAPASTLVISPAANFTAVTNAGAIRFTSLVNMVIDPEEYQSYFNSATRRYEIRIPAIATVAGAAGNVDAGTITQSNVINFFVTNETPFLYGSDQESNRSLAERSLVALMGVDHGTIGGYIKEVVSEPGVLKVNAQGAGDPYMVRDFDPLRKTHLGGKVDLYIQGSRPLVYQEEFGLKFNRAKDEAAKIVNITDDFFTIEVVHGPDTVEKIEKVDTSGYRSPYSLENALITGRQVRIRNSGNSTNVNLGMQAGDRILANYYYTDAFTHEFKHKPVTEIVSVSSQITGSISTGNFLLYSTDDVFQFGNSTLAESRLVLTEDSNLSFSALSFSGSYVLEGSTPVTLDQYAVDLESIIVTGASLTGSSSYKKSEDYRIVTSGSTTEKTELARVPGGRIPDGETVTIFYTASETISVQYQVENAIESVQQRLEAREYATADVLAKKANEVPLDITANIVLQKGVNQSDVDIKVRTALGRYFGNLRLGDSVYQSDIIRVLDGVDGVYSVDTPLLKLARASNGYVLGEIVNPSVLTVTGNNSPYALKSIVTGANVLASLTKDGGGYADGYRRRAVGLYINGRYLKGVSDKDSVSETENSCYISQTDKAIYVSSLTDADRASISDKSAKMIVNYFTYGEDGPHDVQIGIFEYATLSNLVFSYRSR